VGNRWETTTLARGGQKWARVPTSSAVIAEIEKGPEYGESKPKESPVADWLSNFLPDGEAEEEVSVLTNELTDMIWRETRGSDRESVVQARLERLARDGGYHNKPGCMSLQKVIRAYLRAAYARVGQRADVEAQRWAKDYIEPNDVMTRDAASFGKVMSRADSGGCDPIAEIAKEKREMILRDRLNMSRVEEIELGEKPEDAVEGKVWSVDHIREDWDRVKKFASEGVPLVRGERRETTGLHGRPRLRGRYLAMKDVVNKAMIESWWREGLATYESFGSRRGGL